MAYFTYNIQQKFTRYFVLFFYVLAIYKWVNGQFMYQVQPHFFTLRFDGIAWLLMQTDIHKWLLDNKPGWVLFDIAFYSMPLIWWVVWKVKNKGGHDGAMQTSAGGMVISATAIVWLLVNWIYVQCYTLYPTNSVEGHMAWLLMPVLFAAVKPRSFYLLMHGLRYVFLFFFATAALWKFRQGGIFNTEQLSGILLMQHKEFLVSVPDSWYTHFIYWIVKHPFIGWSLYVASAALELFFAVGFFTKKFDRWIFVAFILFLIMDMLVMRIPYFELLPLALPLLFSRYKEPVARANHF